MRLRYEDIQPVLELWRERTALERRISRFHGNRALLDRLSGPPSLRALPEKITVSLNGLSEEGVTLNVRLDGLGDKPEDGWRDILDGAIKVLQARIASVDAKLVALGVEMPTKP